MHGSVPTCYYQKNMNHLEGRKFFGIGAKIAFALIFGFFALLAYLIYQNGSGIDDRQSRTQEAIDSNLLREGVKE